MKDEGNDVEALRSTIGGQPGSARKTRSQQAARPALEAVSPLPNRRPFADPLLGIARSRSTPRSISAVAAGRS